MAQSGKSDGDDEVTNKEHNLFLDQWSGRINNGAEEPSRTKPKRGNPIQSLTILCWHLIETQIFIRMELYLHLA